MKVQHRFVGIKFHLLAFFTASIWGVTFLSTKVLLSSGLTPDTIFLIRFLIGYVVLWVIYPKFESIKHKRDEWLFAALGILGGSLYFLTENSALEVTYASNVALLVTTAPLLTAIVAHLLIKGERLNRSVWLGGMIALIGVSLIVYNGNFVLKINPLGDLLSLAAAFCWAFYSVLLKRLDCQYSIFFITRKVFFYGIVTIIPWFIFFPPVIDWSLLRDPMVWGNLLFLGIVASSLCFLAWNMAIKHLGSIVTNNYIYFIPVVTIVSCALWLDEQLTYISLGGALLILLGVYVSDRKGVGK